MRLFSFLYNKEKIILNIKKDGEIMKIGLRAGHSDNCTGAIGIVDEHEQMKVYYSAIKNVLENYGHTVIDCNSNGNTSGQELAEGAYKANSNNVELFVSLHMNASDGNGHGVEAWVSGINSKAYGIANNLCMNFGSLGFTNRGVKISKTLYEMKYISAPNIIFEICFCDSQTDIDIYNKYSWEKLAYMFSNSIDSNIPKEPNILKLGWNKDLKGWRYYTNVNDKNFYKDSWEMIDGIWYSFDSFGYARESTWLEEQEKWYYLKDNCAMAKSEWIWVDGECYCFNEHGVLYVNCTTPDGYRVDESGAWIQ
ncbi:N-acetylmuramoyl-L-alanine amidase [Clostridium sp. C2-6-12]|uniref:N-acetylmuramoyl-L-alanine amidase n=1 Tax=Clostridium sp. C2-6-12 TaxID=2698832 RepID=UPI001FAD625B|nr:N-acetylmuramoyl-L-alanine amidase [Clostridium sp. C2-6-12]